MQAVRLTLRTVNMRGFGEVQRLARLAVQTWDLAYPLENAPVLSGETEPEIQAAAEGEEQAVVKKDEPGRCASQPTARFRHLPALGVSPSTVMVDIIPAKGQEGGGGRLGPAARCLALVGLVGRGAGVAQS